MFYTNTRSPVKGATDAVVYRLTTALRNTAFLLALVPFVGLVQAKSDSTSANEIPVRT